MDSNDQEFSRRSSDGMGGLFICLIEPLFMSERYNRRMESMGIRFGSVALSEPQTCDDLGKKIL